MGEREDLAKVLRKTTAQMATSCSVPMRLWQEHSTAVLHAADMLSHAQSAWLPIATAPTYETILVAGGDAIYPVTASWDGDNVDGWWVDGQEDVHEQIGWPTHWMPLPAYPVPSTDGKGGA